MKKYIISLIVMFGVGILAFASKSEARVPTDDYVGIAYVTSNSSAVFVTTSCPIELISIMLGAGNDAKTVIIIDTAPSRPINGVNTAGVSTTTLPGWSINSDAYPQSQWATLPMVFNTTTGTVIVPNQQELRGTIIRNGLAIFKDSDDRSMYYTLKYREIR